MTSCLEHEPSGRIHLSVPLIVGQLILVTRQGLFITTHEAASSSTVTHQPSIASRELWARPSLSHLSFGWLNPYIYIYVYKSWTGPCLQVKTLPVPRPSLKPFFLISRFLSGMVQQRNQDVRKEQDGCLLQANNPTCSVKSAWHRHLEMSWTIQSLRV